MFGVIHECIKQVVLFFANEQVYREILKDAGCELGKENIVHHYYEDKETFHILEIACKHLKVSKEQFWTIFGDFFLDWMIDQGYTPVLRAISPDFYGFLMNLDSLHYFVDHLVFKASLRGPTFRCELNQDHSITLHYFSERPGMCNIIKGVLRKLAKKIYGVDISIKVLERSNRNIRTGTSEKRQEHNSYMIRVTGGKTDNFRAPSALVEEVEDEVFHHWTSRLTQRDFCAIQPYHFIMDRELQLVQIGDGMLRLFPKNSIQFGTSLLDMVEIRRPQIELDFDEISDFRNAIFVLELRVPERNKSATKENTFDLGSSSHFKGLNVKGQFHPLSDGEHMGFIGSPYITSIGELINQDMRLGSIPFHDATRDVILLNQQRLHDVTKHHQLEANNERLSSLTADIQNEKIRTEQLLKEVLPTMVADQLMSGAEVAAKEYPDTTVMFTDCPPFQDIMSSCKPTVLVNMLNTLFTKFDNLVNKHEAYKVETIGDSYMTCGGIPAEVEYHAEQMCHLALGMLWESRSVLDPLNHNAMTVRCGVHSGATLAGVIGSKMPRYCLFGDTVNTASVLGTTAPSGRVQVSASAVKCAQETGRFEFLFRGAVPIQGKGRVEAYFLARSIKMSVWDIIDRERDEKIHSIDGYDELVVGMEADLAIVIDDTKSSRACTIL